MYITEIESESKCDSVYNECMVLLSDMEVRTEVGKLLNIFYFLLMLKSSDR